MKTINMVSKIFKAIVLLTMTLGLANCAKNNGSNTPIVGAYQLINNMCYQNTNGTLVQVAQNLCTTAGQYQLINNTCYQLVNGQYVPQANTSLCTMNNYGYNNGYSTQICNGSFTDGYQWVNCGTQFNCSGYTLYNQQGQIVRCQ